MHLAIYKARPDCHVILHSHPLWSSIFAAAGKDVPCCLAEQALYLGGGTKCTPYALVGSKQLGDYIVEALGQDKRTAMIRNHGSVIIGNSFTEVFELSRYLEHAAQVAVLGELLGGVETFSAKPEDFLDACLL